MAINRQKKNAAKTPRPSEIRVFQITPKQWGVFLKNNLLKKFQTKAAAEGYAASIKAKAKKNPVNIFGVVAGLSGVQSLLQIQEMMKKKKPVRRKARAVSNPSGKTTAKRKNPHGEMASGARFNEKLFDQDLAQIEDGNFRLIRSAKAHGRLAGYGASEIDSLVQRARLAFQLKEMYKRKGNPASVAKLLAVPLKNNGAFKRMLSRRKAASALKRELKLEAALKKTREKKRKAMSAATNPKGSLRKKVVARKKLVAKRKPTVKLKVAAKRPPPPKRPAARKRNVATKVPRSRTYERFQGRPVTNATRRPVSEHAPSRLTQLGDLIEIKLVGGQILKPNPARAKLCAANGRLWIAGQKFAKPVKNPANVINPLGEIDYVVYRTYKPHHGDRPGQAYIHKLGEVSGHRPTLCVDRDGFPIIRGGRYSIKPEGIIN